MSYNAVKFEVKVQVQGVLQVGNCENSSKMIYSKTRLSRRRLSRQNAYISRRQSPSPDPPQWIFLQNIPRKSPLLSRQNV